MINVRQRRLISEVAVGLLVCGAAQLFLISPAERELERLRQAADVHASPDAPSTSLSAEQLAEMDRRAERVAAEVVARSQTAADETRLFTAIMGLAEEAGLRVDQLQPVEIPAVAPPPPFAPGVAGPNLAAQEPVVNDSMLGYSMLISGSYAQLVRFVHRVPFALGYTTIRSIRVSPADDRAADTIRAQIETRHFAFDASAFKRVEAAVQPSGGPQ